MKERKIKSLIYRGSGGNEYQAIVGIGATAIFEHQAQGEGDRWYYDIHFDNGDMIRTFSPVKVRYGPEEDDGDDIGDLGPKLGGDE